MSNGGLLDQFYAMTLATVIVFVLQTFPSQVCNLVTTLLKYFVNGYSAKSEEFNVSA